VLLGGASIELYDYRLKQRIWSVEDKEYVKDATQLAGSNVFASLTWAASVQRRSLRSGGVLDTIWTGKGLPCAVCSSPDGHLIAWALEADFKHGQSDKLDRVMVYDTKRGKVCAKLSLDYGAADKLSFTRDGCYLVAVKVGTGARVWKVVEKKI
jgi:hypothetical protein